MQALDLSFFCKTKSEAADFAMKIVTLNEKLYETSFNLEETLLTLFGLQKKEHFLKLLTQQEVPLTANGKIKEFLTKLSDHIAKLPVLSLTIAFEPTQKTLKTFSDWFIQQQHTQMLFDVQVDQTLIGGTIINYQGYHADYSIKQSFQKILTDVLAQSVQQPKTPPATHQPIEQLHLGR